MLRNLAAAAVAACVMGSTHAAAEPITIAALGDSLTHGYGLPPDEAFPVQLEAWLKDHGADVRVINAGVSGDTSAGGVSRLDWTLTPEVDAVIVELGGNDLLRGIDPAATRANLDAILKALDARGIPSLLAGLPAPRNYGPDYKAEFDAIFPDLAGKYGAILYPNFLAGISADMDPAEARGLMQPDGIHPNAKGVALIVADIGPKVLELVDRARRAAGG